MYFLFSWLSLSFWGCEQRPELGKPVILSQNITERGVQEGSSDEEDSNTLLESDSKKTTPSSDDSKNIPKNPSTNDTKSSTAKSSDVKSDQPLDKNIIDPYTQDTYSIDSSEMGTTTKTEDVSETEMEVIDIRSQIQQSALVSWPIQLIAITDTTPRRAILRFANGKELTVQAGHIIEEEKIVILAIGKQRLSAAKIEAQGDVTSIQEIDLQALN